MAAKKRSKDQGPPPVAVNKKARFDFEVLDTLEAGLILKGTEVKSVREGKLSLDEAYARFQKDRLFLIGTYIAEYTQANVWNHETKRRRECLLHKKELRRLKDTMGQKGLTLVPLRVYFNERGYAKVLLGLCKGRAKGDKRQALRKKDDSRAIRDSI